MPVVFDEKENIDLIDGQYVNVKNWWESRILWTAVATIIATIAAHWGLALDVTATVTTCLTISSSIAVIWLRFKTNKSIK